MRTARLAAGLVLLLSLACGASAKESGTPGATHPPPPPMTKQEIEAFLARPLVAHLAVVRANGTPQIVPMWFVYKDGVFYMSTRTYAAKLKHIRKNPRVAVVVDVMDAPLKNKSVSVDGTVEVLTTGVKEVTAEIYRKYVGVDALAGPAAQHNINEPRVILKIVPKKIASMDTTR